MIIYIDANDIIPFSFWLSNIPLCIGSLVAHRICLQYERPGFDPWVGKVPWRREWQLSLVISPREFHEQRSLVGLQSMGSQRAGNDWGTTHIHTHTHTYIFFTPSSVEGNWGCFYALGVVNSVEMNIRVHVSFQSMVFSRYMLRSGIVDCMVALLLVL